MINKDQLISALIAAGLCGFRDIAGASVEEVAELEQSIGAKLPDQYKEFLLGIGKGAGKFAVVPISSCLHWLV